MDNVPAKSPDEIHEQSPKAIHDNITPKEETVEWSTGLCDCRSDVPSWCLTYWFPCITFGRTSEIVDKGSSSCTGNTALYAAMAYFTGCACFYSHFYRTKMRKQYHLKGSPCGDLGKHCFCLSCSLSQEYRELQNRGFDLSIEGDGKYPPTQPAPATGVPMSSYNQNPGYQVPRQEGPWSSGLCDCFSDCGSCCLTCWCPCITFGRIAEIADKGNTSCGTAGAVYALLAMFTGCQCIYSCSYRTKIRSQYMLSESPCNDCLLHYCCETCALCQEYRELEHRGFDMSIGWHENVERLNRGVAMGTAPVFDAGMTR